MTTPADGIALPTSEHPPPVTPRPRRRGWSLRAHILSIVAATIVLVVLAGVLLTAKDYNRARQSALLSARFEARLAANEISTSIPDLRALIVRSGASVGQATGGNIAALPPDKCNLNFKEFRSFKSGVLHIVLPDGGVLCSSQPSDLAPGAHPYAGASWFTPVVQNGSATLGAAATSVRTYGASGAGSLDDTESVWPSRASTRAKANKWARRSSRAIAACSSDV